jgi:hypothetical protein
MGEEEVTTDYTDIHRLFNNEKYFLFGVIFL